MTLSCSVQHMTRPRKPMTQLTIKCAHRAVPSMIMPAAQAHVPGQKRREQMLQHPRPAFDSLIPRTPHRLSLLGASPYGICRLRHYRRVIGQRSKNTPPNAQSPKFRRRPNSLHSTPPASLPIPLIPLLIDHRTYDSPLLSESLFFTAHSTT